MFHLIKTNAVVTVQAATHGTDDVGASSETFAAVATGVKVLLSEIRAGREDRFGGREPNVLTGSASGESEYLARQDTRLLVTAVTGLPSYFVGRYLRVEGADPHGASSFGLVSARVKVRWSMLPTGTGVA